MPEGDVVWRTARKLHEALSGRVLTRSDFRVPRFATADLTGRAVSGTVPGQAPAHPGRGRHHGAHAPEDGWLLADPPGIGLPAAGLPDQADPRERAVAGGRLPARHRRAGAEPARRTGLSATSGPICSGRTGTPPRPFADSRPRPARTIGEALLDQRNLAGIGTIYRARLLFLRGVHPWRPVGDVPDLPGLVEMAQAAAGREQGPGEAHHDRERGARRPGTGSTGGPGALPPVRHHHQARQPGPSIRGADRVLVPGLPARSA